jgi:hypothetical protein
MKLTFNKRRFISDLADVLTNSRAIGLIDFYLGAGDRLHITGSEIIKIGGLIRSEGVSVKIDDASVQAGTPGGAIAHAEYDPVNDRMSFPSSWVDSEEDSAQTQKYALEPIRRDPNGKVFRDTPAHRATLVHEATHAVIDRSGIRVFRLRDEIAARLASTIYLHHTNELNRFLDDRMDTAWVLWQRADIVARREGLYNRLGTRLFRKDLHPLIGKVRELYNLPLSARSYTDGIDGIID